MSTGHSDEYVDGWWLYGLLAGVVAGSLRPAAAVALDVFAASTAAFSTSFLGTGPVWWAIHLVYSVAFAVLFALLVDLTRLGDYATDGPAGAVAGFVYGFALWATNVVLLGGAADAVGSVPVLDASDAFATGPLLGHLLYGAVLGGVYVALLRRHR